MAILIYATEAECWGADSWTGGTAPSNAAALLRSASILVRDATAAAVYDVDTSGLPTDADVLAAFRDATCAHAAALDAAGVDPAAAGADSAIKASTIGSASISYSSTDRAAAARAELTMQLCPEACRILSAAGMLGGAPMVYRGW